MHAPPLQIKKTKPKGNNKMSKHLVVMSIDAFVFEDIEYAKTLPNFAKVLNCASVIERVKTIYPSVTHAVHATLLTGAPAGVTGIVNNHVFKPAAPDTDTWQWYNLLSEIKCDTLLHAAKRAGLTTASSTWPVTAGVTDLIDYHIPSALNYYFDGRDHEPYAVYRELGASEEMIEILEGAVALYGHRDRHPEYDSFQTYCACEIIKKYKPNLLLTHPGDVDHVRHEVGVFGDEVKESIKRTDGWLGQILAALEEAGIADETDIVLLSDHGQINITRVISPNVYLVDNGYIKLDSDGHVKEWDAYVQSAGASAHVYLSRPDDKELYDGVYKLLSDMANEGIYGFERVYTEDELKAEFGLSGDFSFVLEGDGYTGFGEKLVRPAVRGWDLSDYRESSGTHGHDPRKGPQPTFIASGPSFREGVIIERGDILNHAPTLAAVLGVELRDSVGTAVKEILK